MRLSSALLTTLTVVSASLACRLTPAAADCNRASSPSIHLELPGNPFAAVPTKDGCWIFVSLPESKAAHGPGIAVIKREGGNVTLQRVVAVEGDFRGMVLTRNDDLLIVAGNPRAMFLDVGRLKSGNGNPVLGYWTDGNAKAQRFYVNVTSDDRYLFISNEGARSISVLDLDRARATAFGAGALIGTIPVGNAPIALTFSADERYLFSTSQSMPESAGWPIECRPERDQQQPPDETRGAIFVIDVGQAVSNPAAAVVRTVQAGCHPVRLALSPKGDVAYVSARGDHRVLVFDTQKLVSDPARALLGSVPVGTAPVGILTVDGGRRVIVASSNRFAGTASDKQPLYVVDSSKVHLGADAVLGVVQAGARPRELRTSSDGRTLFVTNFNSQTLQVIDLTRLPLEPRPQAAGEK